ncbi:MAG TPA: hypothetical protein VKQ05_01325 [Gemmatimonadales bacterium]|nr:hypothetical protein [Gemmatimonadales bacterium]
MTNPLQLKYFVRRAASACLLVTLACGGKQSSQNPSPQTTAPLPTAGIAGQRVALTPLTLVGAEDTLHLDALIADRRATLDRSDSVIGALLTARAPEVTWVGPAELRRIARRAPGIAADPDQMGTSFLRATSILDIPDPLRYQLRTLMGLVGGRYVLVPAGLVFRPVRPLPGHGAEPPPASSSAHPPVLAELEVVMVDSRMGKVGWRTTARGEGPDAWAALARAVKNLTPGLP